MRIHILIGPVPLAAALLGSLGAAPLTLAAQQVDGAPRPPGVRLVTLPRRPDDKPQETSIAVNPRDPRRVIVSYHQAVGKGHDHEYGVPVTAHVAWSADNGETWAIAPSTTHERYLRSLDASVTFDLHGHAFLAYLALDSISLTTRHGQFVRRSSDGGRTWGAPVTLAERPGREPVMEHFPNLVADNRAASPFAGNLYVTWDRQFANRSELIITRSTDDGRTWSRPRVISTYSVGVLSHAAAVGSDGTVYVLSAPWTDGSMEEIMLAVSRDGGQTFEAPRRVMRTRLRHAAADFPRQGRVSAVAIAVDPRGSPGRLFMVWRDYRYGDMDILASTSDDGGWTWTPPVRVNDDATSNGKDQVLSRLAVDPTDGAAYVVFYDRRSDPENLLATVTLARSTDGGRTFANYAWSVTPTDPNQASLGDYIGLAAFDGRVYSAWIENVRTPQRGPQRGTRRDGEMFGVPYPTGPSAIRIGIADFREDLVPREGS